MFDAYTVDWMHLLFRWFHIITGAAWIGTSFYFIWLNNNIRPPESPEDDGPQVKGVVWAVHGGAFYRTTKYDGAPESLPDTLHWFKWEAYMTWVSGIALLGLVYWGQARTYMIDPDAMALAPMTAVSIGVGSILVGWFGYDLLCRLLWKRPQILSVLGLIGLTAIAWGLTQVLSGRAAFIHVGAILGTIMAANVFLVIIPNQRVMVDAMLAGNEPDVSKGASGAVRSLHNNYLTLPVLFIMVSNHFPFTYGATTPWLVLVAISIIGAVVRHWFNLHGQGQKNAWILPLAALAMLSLVIALKPTPPPPPLPTDETPSWEEVSVVFEERCVPCHADAPTFSPYDLVGPPLDFSMSDPTAIAAKADLIAQQVRTGAMPQGNLTEITNEERSLILDWVAAGAEIPPTSSP